MDERTAAPDAGTLARHAIAIATVRTFLEASRAARVVVVLEAPGGTSVMLEAEPGAPLELTTEAGTFEVAPGAVDGVAPLPVEAPLAPPASALGVDLVAGEIHAPIGVVPSLADEVLALARAFGGRTVASAEFATRDPDVPLTLAARDGEGVVAAAGDEQFRL